MQTAYDVSQITPVTMPLDIGEASIHHAEVIHGSLPNLSDRRRMGITFMYMPASLSQKGSKRTSAMLVRGKDKFSNFESETPPNYDDEPVGIMRHEQSAELYRAKEAELGKTTATRFD